MPSFETSVVIVTKPEAVWRVMSDVIAWPSWMPTVTKVEALDAPQLDIGRRYRVQQPRLRPAIWTVISLEPGRGFSWQTSSPGVVVVGSHRIAPCSEDTTRVTLFISVDGFLAKLVWPFIAGMVRGYVQLEAESLAEKCLGAASRHSG